MITDCYSEIFSSVQKILVVEAHPDDMEVNCGGLIARAIKDGKQARLVITTNGGRGTKDKKVNETDFANSRIKEQINAGKIIGIPESENFNLNFPDGEFASNLENIGKIVFHIRQFKPDIIITHNPEPFLVDFFGKSSWVNHRDHRETAIAVFDAVYPMSRDRGFFPEHFDQGLEPHTVNKLLLADSYTSKNVKYFSIDGFTDQKTKALQEHISAFSPDSVADYLEENLFPEGYFEPLGFYKIY